MDRSRLSILIPAHREAATIGPVVAGASRFGQVIVIDDGSPDDTGAVAAANGAIVIRHEKGRGYEAALNRAFEEAAARGFQAAVTMDADGEHDPGLVGQFRQLLLEEGFALVLGVRARKQRFSESWMSAFTAWRFGAHDILCGMKGYHLSLWQENGGFDKSGMIGTELAVHALRRKARFCEIPVWGTPRPDSPRFDSRWRANKRILLATWKLMAEEFRRAFSTQSSANRDSAKR